MWSTLLSSSAIEANMNVFFPSQWAGLNEAHDLIAYKCGTFSAIISALIVYSFFADLMYSHLTVWRNSVGLSVCCLIFAAVWWLCILFTVLKVSFFPLCTLSSLLRSSECTWGANTHTHLHNNQIHMRFWRKCTKTHMYTPHKHKYIATWVDWYNPQHTPCNTEVHAHTHTWQQGIAHRDALSQQLGKKGSYLRPPYSRKDKPSYLCEESVWNKTSYGSYYNCFFPTVSSPIWDVLLMSQC